MNDKFDTKSFGSRSADATSLLRTVARICSKECWPRRQRVSRKIAVRDSATCWSPGGFIIYFKYAPEIGTHHASGVRRERRGQRQGREEQELHHREVVEVLFGEYEVEKLVEVEKVSSKKGQKGTFQKKKAEKDKKAEKENNASTKKKI